MKEEVKTAKITSCDIRITHHWALLRAFWDYEDGGHGQIPMIGMNLDFVKKFMQVCNEEALRDCEGDIIKVTERIDGLKKEVIKLSPMPFNEGNEFNIEEWKNAIKKEE
jgi:hypothetical protein